MAISPGLETFELNNNYGSDIERQGPPNHSASFLSRIARVFNISYKTENTRAKIASNLAFLVGILEQWNARPTMSSCTVASVAVDLEPQKTAFLDAVTGSYPRSGNLPSACNWYTSFLKSKIKESWDPLFQPVLIGICCTGVDDTPCKACIERSFAFLQTVVSATRRKNLALAEIVDMSMNAGVLKESARDTDYDESDANQLAFAAFGWISLLYTPEPRPQASFLQIFDPSKTQNNTGGLLTRNQSPRYRSKTFENYRQASDYNDQPLFTLLKRFGKIIPERERNTSLIHESSSIHSGRPWIDVSMVSYETLYNVASVKIEWVDCLSSHLEFDSSTRTLKMFRFPSLCFVMCSTRDQSSLLSSIFQDSVSSYEYSLDTTDHACQFVKEVLLSYRLIFGQTKSSRQNFNKQFKELNLMKNSDPMLHKICGHDWDSDDVRDIYNEIGADDPTNTYNPAVDFPFLGHRLSYIQDYVRGHNPTSIWALWCDRRNVSWWWAFWAVIILGGLGLLIALVQTILQILQLYKK